MERHRRDTGERERDITELSQGHLEAMTREGRRAAERRSGKERRRAADCAVAYFLISVCVCVC